MKVGIQLAPDTLSLYGPSVSEMGFCCFVSKNFEGKENIANFAAKWFDL